MPFLTEPTEAECFEAEQELLFDVRFRQIDREIRKMMEADKLKGVKNTEQQIQADSHKKEEHMANWSIASTAPEIEKIKAEMADYLHGLNSCAEIDYSIYSQLFDFSLPLIQEAYELGKKEARQLLQPESLAQG